MTSFGRFDSVWVSTDHPAIAERARAAHEGVRVFWRSPKGRQQPASPDDSDSIPIIVNRVMGI